MTESLKIEANNNTKQIVKQSNNKKILLNCLIIFLVSVLLIIPIMTSNNLYGTDLQYHLSVIYSLDNGWHNGEFLSKIVGLIAQDYGYGTGLFYSTIPAGTAVIFMNLFNLPVNVTLGFELVLLFSLSGFMTYGFVCSYSKNHKISLILSIFYIFSPYILHDLYSRFAFSELFLMLSVPMIFWGLHALISHSNYKLFFPLFTIGFSISFLCHFTLTLYVAIFAFIYIMFYIKDFIKSYKFVIFIVATLLVLLITATYYVPMIMNYGLVSIGDMARPPMDLYKDTLTSFFSVFGFQAGICWAIFIISTILIIKNRKALTRQIICAYVIYLIGFIMTTPIFPWFIMPELVCMIQFPMRINLILCTLSLPVIFYIYNSLFSKTVLIKVVAIVVSAVLLYSFGLNINSAYFVTNEYYSIASSTTMHFPTLSFNHGLGYMKNGDYLPINTDENYLFTRVNDNVVLSSNAEILEFTNYQDLNMVRFIVSANESDSYVDLKIPYDNIQDCSILRYSTNNESNISEFDYTIELVEYNGQLMVRFVFPACDYETQISIEYVEGSALDRYLVSHPFEFIVKSGNAEFSNFVKTAVNEYSVEITTDTETTIELPTLYYNGYSINYVTANETVSLSAINGENGFVEVNVKESGTLTLTFEGNYIDIANIISIIGTILFAITLIALLIIPREKFTNIANAITGYLTKHKTIAEIIRFLIVGGIATLIDMFFMGVTMYAIEPNIYDSFINVFVNTPSPSTFATIMGTTVGFICGLIVNYILSIIFVFNEKGKSKSAKGFIIFALLSLIGLGINMLGTYIGYDLLNLHQWLVKIIMVFVVLVYNYISKKLVLFRDKSKKVDSTDKTS